MNPYFYVFYKLSKLLNKKGNNKRGPINALTLLVLIDICFIYIKVFDISQYTACSVCNPPQKETTKLASVSQTKPTGNNKNQSVFIQCSAITKAGTRCKRTTKSPNRNAGSMGAINVRTENQNLL